MKGFHLKEKHRKLKKYISKVRVNLLNLYASVRRSISEKTDIYHKAQPKALILIAGDKIGDAIVISGLAKKMHDAGYQVNFLAGPSCKNLFSHSTFINNVFLYDRKKSPEQLKKEGFDIVIDPSDNVSFDRINLIYTINANMTIGFNKSKYPMYSESIEHKDVDVHIIERHKKVLDLLGIDSSDYSYSLDINKDDENVILDRVKQDKLKYLIALNPLTSSKDKDLSIRQVKEIINFIQNNYRDIGIILIGDYKKIADYYIDGCIIFHESTINLAAAIVKNADIIITPDTSIVHIARSFNKKMVAIYNNGRLEETGFLAYKIWLPDYENATVIRVNTPNISEFDSAKIIEKIKEIIPTELDAAKRKSA